MLSVNSSPSGRHPDPFRLDEFPGPKRHVRVLLGQRPDRGGELQQVGPAEGAALQLQLLFQGGGEVVLCHGCFPSSHSRASLISAAQAVKKSDPPGCWGTSTRMSRISVSSTSVSPITLPTASQQAIRCSGLGLSVKS